MKSRIVLKIVFLLILVCPFYYCQAASKSKTDISLFISTKKIKYKADEKIYLEIKIINTGRNNHIIPNGFVEGYKFLGILVKDKNGKLVSDKTDELLLTIFPTEGFTIKPGYFFGKELDLNELKNMSKYGSYSIKGIYSISNSGDATFGEKTEIKDCWNGTVESNEIKIKIVK